MKAKVETRYFRQSRDNDRTYRVWRLRPGNCGEWWDVIEQQWVMKNERFEHGLVYWLYVNPPIDLDSISEVESGMYIAGLNRGIQLTSAEVAREDSCK